MYENMGQTIAKLRRDRNLTQEKLAEQLSVSAQAVSKWESAVSPTIGRGGQSPETARSARRWKPIQDGRRGWTVWREKSAETEKTLMYG